MPSIPPDIHTRTLILRMVHVQCLKTLIVRGMIHAPSAVPADRLPYTGIHAREVQEKRGNTPVACGPGGVIRDYVGFYFGPRSPMLLRIQTGRDVTRVPATEIVYLVAVAQDVARTGLPFVFMDRHSLTRLATPFDNLADLNRVSFPHAYADYWSNTATEPDRQERKQAEFLVYRQMPWDLIVGLAVYDRSSQTRVLAILNKNPNINQPKVLVKPTWFYDVRQQVV